MTRDSSAVMPARSCEGLFVRLLVLHCLLSSASIAHGQMMSPLSGQGYPPGFSADYGLLAIDAPNGNGYPSNDRVRPTEVYVSCFLDRLLKVNEQDYGFEAVIFIRLSWADPRAVGEIRNRTTETYAVRKDGDCLRPCHPQLRMCCDSMWLPGLDLVNVWGLPQDRVDFELITLDIFNTTNVQWVRRFNGVFYTPMNFRRFPFDQQVLAIDFWAQGCCHSLRKSSVATKMIQFHGSRRDRRGPDISSWRIVNVSLDTYSFNLSDLVWAGTASNPDELYPLMSSPGRRGYTIPNLFPGEPDSVRILIVVQRLCWYYMASYIFPVLLCVLLSWWTFWISPRNIETRMSVLVALFLSLTALQYTISNQLPASSYITAMGWVMIVSYILIVGATAETMLVYWVFRWYVHADDRETDAGEGSDGINHFCDESQLLPTDKLPEAPPDGGVGEGSEPMGEHLDTADLQDDVAQKARPCRLRNSSVLSHVWSRTLSIRPLARTISYSLELDSSLRRDLQKAKKMISKIETIALWTFPSLYILLLSIIFTAIG